MERLKSLVVIACSFSYNLVASIMLVLDLEASNGVIDASPGRQTGGSA
jgi:hypothetical protein